MNQKSSPVNIAIIEGLIGDDKALIKSFFNKFINSVPTDIDQIKQSILDKDYEACKARTHKLKSSAKAIGAIMFADICQHIESESLQKNQGSLVILIDKLIEEFVNCKQYIDRY